MLVPVLLSMSLAGVPADGLWGDVGVGIYPFKGQKVAPNGLVYKPMFRLLADFNLGTADSYFFATSAYYTEKPKPGETTNKSQGAFDFTKRQIDLNVGYAFGVTENTEARFWLYSYGNINRGKDLNKPFGFKDGFIGALRYYFNASTTTQAEWESGYYVTKEMVDTRGTPYKPSAFTTANITHLLGMGMRGYGKIHLLLERGAGLKEVNTQLGLRYPFGVRARNTALLYLENDFGVDDLPNRHRLLLELRRAFQHV